MATTDKMSLEERNKYLRKMQKRYRKANRKARAQLLDEMRVSICTFHPSWSRCSWPGLNNFAQS
jgi:hypothetical protein